MNTTTGIVLQKIDYSETSLIVKVLTADYGIKSFIYQGAKRSKKKGQLVSPLSVLNITYFQRKESDLAKITTVELDIVFKTIPFNPIKASVVFFINEVLLKAVKEEESNVELFEFVKHILLVLDAQSNISNLPIKFLLELLKYLGYYPIIEENPQFFDYLNGKLSKNQPNHPNYMSGENITYLLDLFNSTLTDQSLNIPAKNRHQILANILDYYKVVLDDFKNLKSLDVLEAILH
jgi:DNA repair protein RecO (recombination protein O)